MKISLNCLQTGQILNLPISNNNRNQQKYSQHDGGLR